MPMADKIMLRKRFVIETVLDTLKSEMGLEHSLHSSPVNAMVHALSCLVAYAFRPGEAFHLSQQKTAPVLSVVEVEHRSRPGRAQTNGGGGVVWRGIGIGPGGQQTRDGCIDAGDRGHEGASESALQIAVSRAEAERRGTRSYASAIPFRPHHRRPSRAFVSVRPVRSLSKWGKSGAVDRSTIEISTRRLCSIPAPRCRTSDSPGVAPIHSMVAAYG